MTTQSDNQKLPRRLLVLVLFMLSGASGLIHEVVWTRLLRFVMGNTTYSITTVLCVFMGGLALGSFLGGRWIDRRRDPLRWFGVLEGVLGLYCLTLPCLIGKSEPLLRWVYAASTGSSTVMMPARFLLCVALLIVPATMMGASLPILTRWFARSANQTGRFAGRLYAVNTFGAVLGVAMAGLWLIPSLGLWRTICTGSALNGVVCLLALVAQRREPVHTAGAIPESPRAAEEPAAIATPIIVTLLVGYGLSGGAAMIYEITWTRVLTLMIGSSVYAFSLLLMAFILGLALGSMLLARFVGRIGDLLKTLAWVEFAIGISSLLVVPLLGNMTVEVTKMIAQFGRSFWKLQAAEFGLVLVVMLVPTVLMGAAFPMVTRAYSQWSGAVGRSVGAVYGANTIGSIIGSFLGGFVLIPLLGVQWTIFAAVTLTVAIGGAFLVAAAPPRHRPRRVVLAGAVLGATVIFMVIIPVWQPDRMSFGPFVQAIGLSERRSGADQTIEQLIASQKTVFYHEGVSATVAVHRNDQGVLSLLVNGRVEATSRGGEAQQRLLAHIPLLFAPHPEKVLTIGLASGITLDAASEHPVKSLDCVELSTGVVAATRVFAAANHHVLQDPRVHLIIDDGRNYLLMAHRRYDVIISQPSDPATAGVADLYTRQFFQTCYRRLNPRGLVCVWLKASSVSPRAFQSVIKSFGATFDDMSVWSATGFTEFLLVGSKGKLSIDYRLLAKRIASPRLRGDMKQLHIHCVADLFGNFVTDRAGAMRFAGDAPLNTDDNALLEFSAPRTEFTRENPRRLVAALLADRDIHLALLTDDRGDPGPATPAARATMPTLAQVKAQCVHSIEARSVAYHALEAFKDGKLNHGMDLLTQAAALNRSDPWIEIAIARLRRATTRLVETGHRREAIAFNRQIVRILPDSEVDRFNLASLLRDAGETREAATEYAQVLRIQPDQVLAQLNLAKLLAKLGKLDEAVDHYRRTIALDPRMHQAMNNLAWIIATAHNRKYGTPAQAVALATRACDLTHEQNLAYLDTLAQAYEAAGQFDEAIRVSRQAIPVVRSAGQTSLLAGFEKRIARDERAMHGNR